jgi:DNA (cytosine-5)-methyltransferase 1
VRPLLLDLYCCQGGAAKGYHDAGFDILGVDIEPQPLYPFPMVRADALRFLASARLAAVQAVHASPPCQFRTQMAAAHRSRGFDSRPDLLTPTRAALRSLGKPYVIENVPGAKAKMSATLALHGGMFNLGVHRPRLFESNVLILAPRTPLTAKPIGVYGERPVKNYSTRSNGNMSGKRSEFRIARSLEEARELMEMPWADWHGCKEAVPPAYTKHIGEQLLIALAYGEGWSERPSDKLLQGGRL